MIAPLLVLRAALPLPLVAQVNELLAPGTFGEAVSGRKAGETSVRIAWPEENRSVGRAAELVAAGLEQSEAFRVGTFPASMVTPRFHRYEVGMRHGSHTDPALLGGMQHLIRRDIAMTLALDAPDGYEGGELVLDLGATSYRWKGEPGDCVLCSPDVVRRIEPVTKGARVIAVSWIQSTIRSFEHRRILSEIGNILKELETGAEPEAHVDALHNGYANLVRLWS